MSPFIQERFISLDVVGVSGLNLVPIDKQAPCYTVSFGIGKLIKYPIDLGVQYIILMVGDAPQITATLVCYKF